MNSESSFVPGKKVGKMRKKDKMNHAPAVVTQFYQTKLCKHFQNGSCLYGNECTSRLDFYIFVVFRFVFSFNNVYP